jgi:hypothetical protein
MIKHMVKVHINMQTEQPISEIGSKTNNMVRELKHGQMVLDTKEVIKMGRKMATEF